MSSRTPKPDAGRELMVHDPEFELAPTEHAGVNTRLWAYIREHATDAAAARSVLERIMGHANFDVRYHTSPRDRAEKIVNSLRSSAFMHQLYPYFFEVRLPGHLTDIVEVACTALSTENTPLVLHVTIMDAANAKSPRILTLSLDRFYEDGHAPYTVEDVPEHAFKVISQYL